MEIFIIVLAALLVSGILFTFLVSYIIFRVVLVRTEPEKWGYECSIPDDTNLIAIYKDGENWGDENNGFKQDVSIESDGFKLFGEYFDFSNDKAVIIIPGRMEACHYSRHFALPYQKAGYNVLIIDNRSHGKSEGKYNSLGFKEHRDIIAWAKFLHDTYNIKSVVLHGICIGSSTALFAITSDNCPDYITAMTADGMYVNFYESFKNHMIEQKRPMFPFLLQVMMFIRIFTGANVIGDGPLKRMDKMKKPILFIHSKTDIYSLPEKAEVLYDLCPSPNKKIVWFENGKHSCIRIKFPKEYDDAVTEFYNLLNQNTQIQTTSDV